MIIYAGSINRDHVHVQKPDEPDDDFSVL